MLVRLGYYCLFVSFFFMLDAGGRRNAVIRKENGVEEGREKAFRQSPAAISKGADSIQPLHVEK